MNAHFKIALAISDRLAFLIAVCFFSFEFLSIIQRGKDCLIQEPVKNKITQSLEEEKNLKRRRPSEDIGLTPILKQAKKAHNRANKIKYSFYITKKRSQFFQNQSLQHEKLSYLYKQNISIEILDINLMTPPIRTSKERLELLHVLRDREDSLKEESKSKKKKVTIIEGKYKQTQCFQIINDYLVDLLRYRSQIMYQQIINKLYTPKIQIWQAIIPRK